MQNDVTQNTWNISIKLYSQIYAILCKTFSFSFSSLHFGNLNLSTTLRIFSRHGKTSLILRERSQNFPYKCVSIFLLMFLYLKNQMKFMALAAKESLASQIRSHTLCWDPVRKAYVLSVLVTVWQIWRMSSSCINKKKKNIKIAILLDYSKDVAACTSKVLNSRPWKLYPCAGS